MALIAGTPDKMPNAGAFFNITLKVWIEKSLQEVFGYKRVHIVDSL